MNDTVAEYEREVFFDQGIGNARLVELKSGRSGPCFFLVPGTGGRIEGFAELASLLDTPMPVFAIEARGVDGNGQPDDDTEALVRHYIGRIRTQQPNGPYFLLGHSFGGMVVFEMAQRLLAMGERIGCLILLDTPLPHRFWPLHFLLANFGSRLHGHFKRITSGSVRGNVTYYLWRLNRRRKGLHNIPTDLKVGADAAHILLANDMLAKKWRPEFYPGRLTLFCARDTKHLDSLWHGRVGEVEIHEAEGDHIALIQQPYVSSLSRDMSACLSKASTACDLNLSY
jgi:thioesterase domain-containing protein